MIKSEKRLKELDLVLTNGNGLRITEAIDSLRNTPPFEGAIRSLIACYNKSDDSSLRIQIMNFMNDLKDHSAIEEVMTEIKREIIPDTLRMLISSCWQSGLNYSDYTSDFAGIFLSTEDYMTAIECFTVIESSAQHMTQLKKDEIIKMIKENNDPVSDETRTLRLELISMLT